VVDSADIPLQLHNCSNQIVSLKRTSFSHGIVSAEKLIVPEGINENPMASLENE
jgi:hypothetical protein